MRVLLNPAGYKGTEAKLEFQDLAYNFESAQALVGGPVELVQLTPTLLLEGTKIIMGVDGEGALRQKPINWPASALYGTQVHGDYIYGDVFFIGEHYGQDGANFVDFPDMPVEAVRGAFSRHIITLSNP